MQMTFEEYDQLLEKFEKLNAVTCYPTVEQIDRMEAEPDKWILFACYLYDFGKKARTKEEEYSRKNLATFINKNLQLIEEVS